MHGAFSHFLAYFQDFMFTSPHLHYAYSALSQYGMTDRERRNEAKSQPCRGPLLHCI